METHLLSPEHRLPFILGGHALFTVRNTKTGTRFTYKVTIPKDQVKGDARIHFVALMTGSDNTSWESFSYIGTIQNCGEGWQFYHGIKSRCSAEAPGVLAFGYVFNKFVAIGIDHPQLEIWHEGQCCRCGRTLTVPESIEDGIGPECKKIQSKVRKLKVA